MMLSAYFQLCRKPLHDSVQCLSRFCQLDLRVLVSLFGFSSAWRELSFKNWNRNIALREIRAVGDF
jgi:hypothetical protein